MNARGEKLMRLSAISCAAFLALTVSAYAQPSPFAPLPAAGPAHAIGTGGTAVAVIKGPVRGCYVVNPINAAAQGIANVENAYLDVVSATPGSTDAAGNGTVLLMLPGDSWSCPFALSLGQNVMMNAATAGHAFTVVSW
jgi:hypothetical protein